MSAGIARPSEAGLSDDRPAFGAYALSPGRERLRLWAQGLGRGKGARWTSSLIRRLVTVGRPGPYDVEAFPGQKARLYPTENLSDKRVFAGLQFWDTEERTALAGVIREVEEPAIIVDAGANAGLYTLAVRSESAGKGLKILAIEPDPENIRRMRFNLAASGARDVTVAEVALGDREGQTRIQSDGANRGELTMGESGTLVAMRPLLSVVEWAGLDRVDALKIDIEGMEDEVLGTYFDTAPEALWPRLVILEARRGETTPALARLTHIGYRPEVRTRMNAVLRLPRPGGRKRKDADNDQA